LCAVRKDALAMQDRAMQGHELLKPREEIAPSNRIYLQNDPLILRTINVAKGPEHAILVNSFDQFHDAPQAVASPPN
jgi:hypothetical protein